jgi:hypothetical protein
MPQFSDLANRVKQLVQGFSQNQQQWSYLTGNILTSDTTLAVNDATQISRGMAEIGNSELILIKTVNQAGNSVTLDPFGRGWNGTTAVAWPANTRIENNVTWPNIWIKAAINDAIRSVYPDLWAVGTTTLTKNSVVYEYQLPADAEEVISVQNQLIGPSHVWPFCRTWRFVGQGSPTDFSTGKSLYIADDIVPGRQIYVTYQKEPTELVNDTDDFATVTGLPASAQDVIVYAACMKLVVQFEAARLAISGVEASERAQYVQPGSATRISGYFGQLYKDRLEQECRKLRDRYPRPSHYDY